MAHPPITISPNTPYVNTFRAARRAAKAGPVVVWQRPSDGMVTYVWSESGKIRRRRRGCRVVRVAEACDDPR